MLLTASTIGTTLTASRIGTDVLIKTMSTTTTVLYKLVKFIANTDHPGLKNIQDTLESIDLEYDINVIDKLVTEHDHISDMKDSVKEALLGVTKILQKIHDELHIIKKAYEKHKNKYFYKWRSFQCKYNIETIVKHKEILDSRYDMLIKLLIIYRDIHKEVIDEKHDSN